MTSFVINALFFAGFVIWPSWFNCIALVSGVRLVQLLRFYSQPRSLTARLYSTIQPNLGDIAQSRSVVDTGDIGKLRVYGHMWRFGQSCVYLAITAASIWESWLMLGLAVVLLTIMGYRPFPSRLIMLAEAGELSNLAAKTEAEIESFLLAPRSAKTAGG